MAFAILLFRRKRDGEICNVVCVYASIIASLQDGWEIIINSLKKSILRQNEFVDSPIKTIYKGHKTIN